MSSSISLVTYAGQTVTPQDDALVYESALGDGGIIYGGEVTLKNANTLHINAGHGVIAGRKFTIFASDIAIPLSASGTLLGRLYIHMDLGNTADPIDILYETGNSLTPPVQDADVNIINGVFEFNLATFTVSTSTIADLSNIYPQIQYANSGSFIYVDTISPELIGAQVEVTDGVDTITAIFDANGRAELKNVFMTGTLQITASSGIYSAGTTLSVPYFGTYNVSLALWMATLNISTSNSVLFGQQITITDSSSAVIGTTTFSNVGTATFIVGAPDVYTLSVTYGGNTYTSTVNVTSETTYNVSINTLPDGATVLPTDDVQTWLSCAGISDKAYTTLNEVLADSETYNALLGDSNACAYMKRSTTWSTDICASQYAMNLLGQYDTACDALLSDSTWTTALNNSSYWDGHTDSGVLIHGGNPTYDSFYRIVDGNNVPVTDPSLLDAGTYTIYSNGLAKDPDNLSNDYGKTIRICPNTKEIVVRPDNSLYWYGIKRYDLEVLNSSNGWTCQTYRSFDGTVNEDDTSMTLVPSSATSLLAIGSNYIVSEGITVHAIGKWLITSGSQTPDAEYAAALTSKSFALSTTQIIDEFANFTNAISHVSAQFSNGGYVVVVHDPYNSKYLQLNIQALWYE